MKKIFLFISSLLILCSCTNSASNNNAYNIELNKENLTKYIGFNIKGNTYGIYNTLGGYTITTYGTLSYALYNDCTLTYKYYNSDKKTDYELKTISLNAAGECTFSYSKYYSFTTSQITNITGYVIFTL